MASPEMLSQRQEGIGSLTSVASSDLNVRDQCQ